MKTTGTGQAKKEMPSSIVREKCRVLFARLRERWAEQMSKLTSKLSRRTLYIIWGLFVCAGTAYNVLILSGLFKAKLASHGNIEIPVGSIRKDIADSVLHSNGGVKDLQALRATIDSLERTTEGKAVLDSIALKRPGLMDSIRQAEELLTKY